MILWHWHIVHHWNLPTNNLANWWIGPNCWCWHSKIIRQGIICFHVKCVNCVTFYVSAPGITIHLGKTKTFFAFNLSVFFKIKTHSSSCNSEVRFISLMPSITDNKIAWTHGNVLKHIENANHINKWNPQSSFCISLKNKQISHDKEISFWLQCYMHQGEICKMSN